MQEKSTGVCGRWTIENMLQHYMSEQTSLHYDSVTHKRREYEICMQRQLIYYAR